MKFVSFFDPKQEIDFTPWFRPSLILAASVPVICIVGLFFFGMNWGIDFVGGMEMQVKFAKKVESGEIRNLLEEIGFNKHQVQSYGAEANNEMLVRVERLATFEKKDVEHIKQVLVPTFGEQVSVTFQKDMGDRLSIHLPAPANYASLDPNAALASLQEQQTKLASVIEEKSGFHLRRAKDSNKDSIIRDEPKNGTVSYSVQFIGISDKIAEALTKQFGQAEIRRVAFVDSQVSQQLRTSGVLAVFYALLAILIYIAVRFDLFFSPGALVALLQDTFGALLVFVIGRFEFDLPSVAAILTVVGCSISNTIVVFDRIRETLPAGKKHRLDAGEAKKYVNTAINETLSRSINTTLVIVFTSSALWLLAGGVIQSFALCVTVGIILGAFSSTFAAPATYLWMQKNFAHRDDLLGDSSSKGTYTREDKARGVV